MTALDYVLLVILAGSALVGLLRGLFREAMSLAVWVLAIWAASHYAAWLAPFTSRWLQSEPLQLWAARLLMLVGVLLLGGLVTWLVAMVVHAGRLGAPDRAAGMAFGLARGVLLGSILVVLLRVVGLTGEPWWQESKLLPYAIPVADALRDAAAAEFGQPDGPAAGLAPAVKTGAAP